MISQKNRFHGYGSLNFTYKHGRTYRSEDFTLKYAINERRKRYRLSVVVSKKVSPSAVVRNRIRRRLYEVFRSQENQINKPYDLILSVFSNQFADMPFEAIKQKTDEALTKTGIINT
ncbi:MAG TPA: ribonuclease P protein component [Candidatus Saccharimonadales bacterium]|nr:ribonuclease P protein component [Candidatus Saccharimonadales bacterium]